MLTLVASALAGGDCIDDADALRAGGTQIGCMVKAPSTLGTFLRSFRWGHVRQLDRVSRQLLARAWAAGAGPGDSPLHRPGLDHLRDPKEGARHHGYTGARGYHPLLHCRADVPSARGPGQFLRETVGRVRLRRGYSTAHGAKRLATLSFPPAGTASPSPSASRQPASPDRDPEEDWTFPRVKTAAPMYSRPSRTPRRCIRRPVPNSPSSPDTAITAHRPLPRTEGRSSPPAEVERHTRLSASTEPHARGASPANGDQLMAILPAGRRGSVWANGPPRASGGGSSLWWDGSARRTPHSSQPRWHWESQFTREAIPRRPRQAATDPTSPHSRHPGPKERSLLVFSRPHP